MEEFSRATETTSTRLLDDVRHLHPNLQFCGEPRNAILSISDDLLRYVLSLLDDNRIHAPQASIDEWSELLSILRSHWVSPLLYWHLGRLQGEFRPPEPVVDRMRTAFQWSRTRCFHMERQLREVVAAFEKGGVRILVLKGPAYGRTVYPDPALRPASDLDLLVRPDDMVQARTILEGLDYKCEERKFGIKERLYAHEEFVHKRKQRYFRTIELHWRLHALIGIKQEAQTEELFDRAIRVESSSLTFEALDLVDALIHTAINNAYGHDHCMRLIWAYDIKMIALKLAVPGDWELLQKRCGQLRARRAVELSLEMARAWMGLRLPQGFDDFSAWPQPTDIEADAWQKVVHRHHRLLSMIRLRMPADSGAFVWVRLLSYMVFSGRWLIWVKKKLRY